MAKIQLNDTMMDILLKLSVGNPGAATVLINLTKSADEIDPDSFSGHLGCFLQLDRLEIYGSDIWVLYKDLCDSSIHSFVAVLRANQLGFVSESTIKTAILSNSPQILEADKLLAAVKNELPNFAK